MSKEKIYYAKECRRCNMIMNTDSKTCHHCFGTLREVQFNQNGV